jgi:hypothetical protein
LSLLRFNLSPKKIYCGVTEANRNSWMNRIVNFLWYID